MVNFSFRTLDATLKKLRYISGYNATSINYEIDKELKRYVRIHLEDETNQIARIVVRTDDDAMKHLKQIADSHGLSTNRQLEVILENYVHEFEKFHGEIRLDD